MRSIVVSSAIFMFPLYNLTNLTAVLYIMYRALVSVRLCLVFLLEDAEAGRSR